MTLLYIIIAIIAILLVICIVFVRKANKTAPDTPPAKIAADCCGSHAVCERDSLLSKTDNVVYFDDEELDVLSGIPATELDKAQISLIEDVFFSLREQDVSGWLRSLQLREIDLPADIRDQALLIISERRQNTLDNWNKTHNKA